MVDGSRVFSLETVASKSGISIANGDKGFIGVRAKSLASAVVAKPSIDKERSLRATSSIFSLRVIVSSSMVSVVVVTVETDSELLLVVSDKSLFAVFIEFLAAVDEKSLINDPEVSLSFPVCSSINLVSGILEVVISRSPIIFSLLVEAIAW